MGDDIPSRFYRENVKTLSRCGVTRSCSKRNVIGFFERLYNTTLRFVLYINDTLVSEIANYSDAYVKYNDLCREN